MRFAAIKTCDINNGPGVRVSLWTQGCQFRCEGCHNPETHDFNGGKVFEFDDLTLILKEIIKGQNFSILGGEPLVSQNLSMLECIVKHVKLNKPDTNIWLWTGNKFEDIRNLELIRMIDVIVDGRFDEDKYDENLKYRGSSNQRVIDVKKSLNMDTICLYDEE